MDRDTTVNARMQRSIWLPAGETLSGTLFPDDTSFTVREIDVLEGDICNAPCKLIRVSAPHDGRLTARVTWVSTNLEFYLWVTQPFGPRDPEIAQTHGTSGDLTATLRVIQGIDVLVHFGLAPIGFNSQILPASLPFRVITSLDPTVPAGPSTEHQR